MVAEISITFGALEMDDSLGSAEATGSSGVVCALEHGGEFISPGAGGRQSANAANAKANVRAMAAPSLFRVFMVFSFRLMIVVASFSKRPRPSVLQNRRLVLNRNSPYGHAVAE